MAGTLIRIFFSHPLVKTILFNDVTLHPGLKAWSGHDNHFHVAIKAGRNEEIFFSGRDHVLCVGLCN